jgi:tryptophan-rich sensory protein
MTTATIQSGSWNRWLMLLCFVVVCFAAAAIGSVWTSSSLETWYPALVKPGFNPPNWIFGPVWTVLYVMMAVAAWLVWQRGAPPPGPMVWIPFFTQLTLNTAWSGIFFGLRQPGWAAAEIALLWLAIAATILAFRVRSRTAAWLLVPYLAWVSFASLLNVTIWRLNA